MGNSLAVFMLFIWPLVVVLLFRLFSVPKAFTISVLGGYLLLPVSPHYNLPLLPPYDKTTAAILPALFMAILVTWRTKATAAVPDKAAAVWWQTGWLPQSAFFKLCFITIFIAGVGTVLTNGDEIVFPLRTLPAQRPYDAASLTLTTLTMLLPFLMARKYLARPEDQMIFLKVLVVAALLYSLPALWEVRMSPRLNAQIYGFFPHDWRQHLRAGGFRPVVFLEHGLRLGLFFALGLLALAILLRTFRDKMWQLSVFGIFWLLAVLVLSKTLTAFLIVVLLLPAVLFLRPRSQILVAAFFAGTVLLYPMARMANLVPIEPITNVLSIFVEDRRISSLNYRLANEDILLEKANERPYFGWGGWARARVYDERGRDITTTDGTWIIEFGEKGWVGYVARFGLLTLPILLLAVRRRRDKIPAATSGIAILLAGNLLDLVPNSALTVLTWMMAGSLVGFLERKPEMDEQTEDQRQAHRKLQTRTTRFPPSHARQPRPSQEPSS